MALVAVPAGVPGGASETLVTISNGHLVAVVTPVLDIVRPGSLKSLVDLQTGQDLTCGLQFGGIQCGPFIPADGTVVLQSDSEAVFWSSAMTTTDGSVQLPIECGIEYRLVGRGLEMTFTVTATGEAAIESPLEIDFCINCYDTLTAANQSGTDRVVPLDGTHGILRISGDQVIELSGDGDLLDAGLILPNPSWTIVRVTDHPPPTDDYLSVTFFDTEPPRETATGPWLHSTLPPGSSESIFVRYAVGGDCPPVFLSAHPAGLERSASWMMDDIPFRHPPDDLWAFSETSSGDEYVSAWLIALLEAHPSLSMNWVILPDAILGPNCDSMWAEEGMDESWSHWHCTWRLATLAPPEYLQWLSNVQDDVYPWADRVTLGSHGYHHTPSPDSAWDPYHEFITFEPEEHLERFAVIRQDLSACGLDTSLIHAIRYPGHRTSQSGLEAAMVYGYDFYCNGVRWYEWMGGEPFWDQYLSHYVVPGGEMWGTNTAWWGDYQSMYPCEYLSKVMDRGKHALLGGHPIAMWGNGQYAAWARIDSLCSSLESLDHFGWLLPEEYGAFLAQTSGILFESIRAGPSELTAVFSGAATEGQTAVAALPGGFQVSWVFLDGSPIGWETRGERLFSVLPDLGQGTHTLVICREGSSTGEGHVPAPPGGPGMSLPCPLRSRAVLALAGFPPGSRVGLDFIDSSGRISMSMQILTDQAGSAEVLADLGDLPVGLYFAAASCPEGDRIVRRTVLTR